MRIWARILSVAGIALAWVGLSLTWERWNSLSGADATTGFDLPEARWFLYALVVASVLAVAYVARLWKPLSIALTIAACVLLGFAVRAALDLYATGGTFVDDRPAAGLWVSAAGALVLIVAARPVLYALGAGALPLLAVALWAAPGVGDGRIEAIVTEHVGTTMALDGDTVLNAAPTGAERILAFDPDGERSREVFDTAGVKSSFAERINALVRQGDVLYASVSNTGLMRIPLHGRAQLVVVGTVDHPDGVPFGHPLKVPGFHPSRLAAAPDGSIYVVSDSRVYRFAGGKLAAVAGTGARGFSGDGGPAAAARLDAPQDIAVDRQGRLYIADTGNGRVRRVERDGTVRTILGSAAAPRCAQRGGDDPQSLDPTRCHAIEALAVDSRGNVFVATGGIPRVLALTPAGHYGVVAGTGVAGIATRDGRAVSAAIGGVNKLAIGPDDDLFISEYERALRVADPLKGLGSAPAPAPASGPRAACQAVANWGAAELRAKLVVTGRPIPTDALVAAIDTLPDAGELKHEVDAAHDKQYALEQGGRAHAALVAFGESRCGLFAGLYPMAPAQAMRFCVTYLREWDQVDELSPGDDRQLLPAAKSAPLLPGSMLPRELSRQDDWREKTLEFAGDACAIPYRWATRFTH